MASRTESKLSTKHNSSQTTELRENTVSTTIEIRNHKPRKETQSLTEKRNYNTKRQFRHVIVKTHHKPHTDQQMSKERNDCTETLQKTEIMGTTKFRHNCIMTHQRVFSMPLPTRERRPTREITEPNRTEYDENKSMGKANETSQQWSTNKIMVHLRHQGAKSQSLQPTKQVGANEHAKRGSWIHQPTKNKRRKSQTDQQPTLRNTHKIAHTNKSTMINKHKHVHVRRHATNLYND